MREIKFRGKREDNSEWVYGYYVKDPKGQSRIYFQPFEGCTSNTYFVVDPDTVGQCLQLTDKSRKEAFGGDIFIDCHGYVWVFKQDNLGVWAEKIGSESWTRDFTPEIWKNECMIIGNIHENPELLK